MSFFFYDLATIENDLATRFYDLATRNLSLPPKPWQGHFLLWQIHRFCVLGHFLPHDSFRAKVGTQLPKKDIATLFNDLATLRNDLASPINDLATFSVARSFLCVANPLIWCVRSF